MKSFRIKADLLDKAPATLLMGYSGENNPRLAIFDRESPKIGVLGLHKEA